MKTKRFLCTKCSCITHLVLNIMYFLICARPLMLIATIFTAPAVIVILIQSPSPLFFFFFSLFLCSFHFSYYSYPLCHNIIVYFHTLGMEERRRRLHLIHAFFFWEGCLKKIVIFSVAVLWSTIIIIFFGWVSE